MLESGLIIDMGNYSVTVLTRDNGYYKILRKPTMYISQEIQFKRTDVINIFYFAKRSSIVAAAAILVVFAVFFYTTMKNDKSQNLEYVSLDTNISIQFTINGDEKVEDVRFISKNAKEVFGEWNPQGMDIQDTFNETVKRCREKGIINTNGKNFFLVSGTFHLDKKMKYDQIMDSDEKITTLLKKLKGNIDSMSPGENETLIIKCNPNYKEAVNKNNISLGRYALYSELNKSGFRLSLEDAKNSNVSDLLKAYRNINPNAFTADTPLPLATPYNTFVTNNIKETFANRLTNTQTPVPIKSPTFTSVLNSDSGKEQGNAKNATGTPSIAESITPTPLETGSGLRGEYYDNIDLTNLKSTRIDSQINFKWTSVNPLPKGIRDDGSYSARWMGQIKPPQSGKYTFYITRDNGVRLWIDNKLIIDKWTSEWNITDSGTIVLEGGKKYDIKIEYFNNAGIGTIKLEWSSSHVDKTVVPASCLFPSTSPLPVQETVPGDGTGLSREYYDNPDLTSLKVTGTDPEINFKWGVGSPDLAVKADQQFSIRWSGYVQPLFSEDYIFYITHDDGIRLWINGQLEIDNWKTGQFNSKTRKISLKAGRKYKIKLEYFNNSVAGRVILEWSSASTKRSVVPMSRLFPLK